ncbi:MAG: type II secretion system protein [Planctomycetota bacterium]
MQRRAWTLIELLVVVAILSLLVTIAVPALSGAIELARVARAKAELCNVCLALEVYAQEHDRRYPPQQSYCSEALWEHSAQLPPELAAGGYLPAPPPGALRSAAVEDVFMPGQTYKYQKPGWGLHNNAAVPKGLWIPDGFPNDPPDADPATIARTRYDNVSMPTDADGDVIPSPIRYALWSVGPRYDPGEGAPPLAPVAKSSWYAGCGQAGVVPFLVTREGQHITCGK